MPRRGDLSKIMILGSGPIVIGQAAEFDYSGVQACKVLKEEGYEVVLVNSNSATIMTDPEFADATYVEPLLPGLSAHGEAVVLRRDGDAAAAQVLDGVVGAAVAEGQLERVQAHRAAQQLVAQADAPDRQLAHQAAQGPAGLGAGVVELGRLPDHDRPRPDDQDGPEVLAQRHQVSSPCP